MKKTNAKDRLVETALKLFAMQGFEGTSTRELANNAKVNISAITYYFGSKESLYQATLEYIANVIRNGLIEDLKNIIPLAQNNNLNFEESRKYLLKILKNLTLYICGDKVPSYMVSLMIREQLYPTRFFNTIYKSIISPMHETFTNLFARATNQNPKDNNVILEAHSLIGQIFIFRTHQEIINKRLKTESYIDNVEKIAQIILKHTEAILDSYIKASGDKL